MCECDKLKYWKISAYLLAIVVVVLSLYHHSRSQKPANMFHELFRKYEDDEGKSWFPHVENTV